MYFRRLPRFKKRASCHHPVLRHISSPKRLFLQGTRYFLYDECTRRVQEILKVPLVNEITVEWHESLKKKLYRKLGCAFSAQAHASKLRQNPIE